MKRGEGFRHDQKTAAWVAPELRNGSLQCGGVTNGRDYNVGAEGLRTLLDGREPLVSRDGVGIEEHQNPFHVGGDFREQLHSLRTDGVFEVNKAGDAASWPVQGRNEPLPIRIGHCDKHDWHIRHGTMQNSQDSRGNGYDQVWSVSG